MFPRQYLPAELDPIWVDMPLNDIPLCWFGAPLLLPNIIKYAKEYAFDCPATTPHLAWIPGAVDEGKCWYNICQYFYRQTKINMRIKDVWNQRLPVIVFWSNRELVNVEDVMFRQVGMLLRDMEYEKKYSPRWYLDRGQEVSCPNAMSLTVILITLVLAVASISFQSCSRLHVTNVFSPQHVSKPFSTISRLHN